MVVVVAAGRGGSGHTELALNLATILRLGAGDDEAQVLLVDSDRTCPGVDLRLGAANLDQDRASEARLDRVMARLAELAERRLQLNSLLWEQPGTGIRALLAPARYELCQSVGSEHLDYLLTYFLAPTFDAIVVDLGSIPYISEDATLPWAHFWLRTAQTVLIPTLPRMGHLRSARESEERLRRIGVNRVRFIVAEPAGSGGFELAQRYLGEGRVAGQPWLPASVTEAVRTFRSLVEVDQTAARAIHALVPDLVAPVRGSD
ncbi:MAG: hypothetical protein ACREOD_09910 [Candidatus Dormibacteria bacterium]